MQHGKILRINASRSGDNAVAILKALGSEYRLRILQLLGVKSRSVNQLADLLQVPTSTAAMHVKVLEDVGLIHTELLPAARGLHKVCSRTFEQVLVDLPPLEQEASKVVEIAMPVGAFVDCEVLPTCGLASEASIIGMMDDPVSFLEPDRIHAQLLWFRQGYVEYRFPNRVPPGATATALHLRMEVCSEAPTHNENWPSDITVWVNGVEIGTWTSPGDFGGTRGALTPSWWLDTDSQFGLLKRWEVSGTGTFVDGVPVSEVTLADLDLGHHRTVTIRVGVKDDAQNIGGLNLFGRKFGNYPEDVILRILYEHERAGLATRHEDP